MVNQTNGTHNNNNHYVSSLMATIRSLQNENHALKSELGFLKDEMKQKDTLISTLESQLRILVRIGSGGSGGGDTAEADDADDATNGVITEGEGGGGEEEDGIYCDNDDDALSRISSLGFSSAISPIRHAATLTPQKQQQRQQEQQHAKATSNLPPPLTSPMAASMNRNNNEINTEPRHITTIQEQSSSPSTTATTTTNSSSRRTSSHENSARPPKPAPQSSFNGEHPQAQNTTTNVIQTSKGAIKALPRELSIYNSNDDDVTKYSIDDGRPHYVVDEKSPIPFRDAYNARGLYSGSINREHQLPDGVGKMNYNIGGNIYEGDWSLGHWHGSGKVMDSQGNIYEGQFVNDLKHGQGREVYTHGRIFEGTFVEGDAVDGTLLFPNSSSKYVGQMQNGQSHGYGTYYFEDGSVYKGYSNNNKFEGHGKVTWPDGGYYEGEWKDGTMDGVGKEIRPDGSLRHDGKWTKGVPIREG